MYKHNQELTANLDPKSKIIIEGKKFFHSVFRLLQWSYPANERLTNLTVLCNNIVKWFY